MIFSTFHWKQDNRVYSFVTAMPAGKIPTLGKYAVPVVRRPLQKLPKMSFKTKIRIWPRLNEQMTFSSFFFSRKNFAQPTVLLSPPVIINFAVGDLSSTRTITWSEKTYFCRRGIQVRRAYDDDNITGNCNKSSLGFLNITKILLVPCNYAQENNTDTDKSRYI